MYNIISPHFKYLNSFGKVVFYIYYHMGFVISINFIARSDTKRKKKRRIEVFLTNYILITNIPQLDT